MSISKYPVTVTLSPRLNAFEIVKLADETGDIQVAGSVQIQLDPVSRVASDDILTQAIKALYVNHQVPLDTPTVLVLPSFFSREVELPTDFSRDELQFALISEAERFSLFKNLEPTVSSVRLSTNETTTNYYYSAFPVHEVELYQSIFTALDIPLIAIDLNYLSILRGLMATQTVSQEVEEQTPWLLMVLTDNTFFLSLQQGNRITKTFEARLSVSSSDPQAAMADIQEDFAYFCEGEAYAKMVLVSNADTLQVETLMRMLPIEVPVVPLEQNANTLETLGALTPEYPCSLEAIGGVFYSLMPEMPAMNFKPQASEEAMAINEMKKKIFIGLVVVNALALLFVIVLWAGLNVWKGMKETQIHAMTQKINQINMVGSLEQYKEIKRNLFSKKVIDSNTLLNNVVVKLGSLAEGNTWFDALSMSSSAAEPAKGFQLILNGKSLAPDSVDKLVGAMNRALNREDFHVEHINPLQDQSVGSYYEWQVTVSPRAGEPGIPGAP
ncbi:MAG: hypothetical protein AB7P76_11975 [Candidatus Melainabacteria bacterium]